MFPSSKWSFQGDIDVFQLRLIFPSQQRCFKVHSGVSNLIAIFIEITEMFSSGTAESAVRTVEPICLPGPKPNSKRIIIYKL